MLVVLAIAMLGCDKKKDSSPTAAPAATPAAQADQPTAQPPPKIDCAKAIPETVIAKYFPKATAEHGEPFAVPDGGFVTSCRFVDKDPDRRTIVQYRCGEVFANLAEYLRLIESQVAVKYERIAGIGRGAYKSTSTFGVLHRSLPCIIEVEELSERPPPDHRALVTDLEAALAP
jgi:hypothetical protein